MKKFLIIANPVSGSFIGINKLEQLKTYFSNQGIYTEIYLTQYKNSAIDYCLKRHSEFTDFIAVGGDGAINEICQIAKYREINLGIIPAGTANVLAKEFNIPENDIFKSAEIILKGYETKFDCWVANDKIFVLFVSGGIDSAAVENINPLLKKITGKTAYVYSFIKKFIFFNLPDYNITVSISNDSFKNNQHKKNNNQSETHIITKQFFLTNIEKYAGNFSLNCGKIYSDKIIELIYFKNISRLKLLKFVFYMIFKKNILSLDYIGLIKSDEFKITGSNSFPVEFDGDSGLYIPLCITPNKYCINIKTGKKNIQP
ncbi:hypothetical protein KA977_06885 [Candidatus Dependentiae bacterium]|nr:hypothetical protein [Candidatus Dependentiae bacterium]